MVQFFQIKSTLISIYVMCLSLQDQKYIVFYSKSMSISNEDLKNQFPQITLQQFQARYSFPQPIGRGSYGIVMSASTPQGLTVAIKQFNHDSLLFFRNINREIVNLRLLNHINIVAYYDCFVVDGDTFLLITQFCSQGSLKDYALNELKDFEKMKICLQIVQGLAYAHENNIVHRDIKPQNIFIALGGIPKLGDFGCSTLLQQEVDVMNSRVGTAIWADPKVNSGRYTKMVDIYSLALVFIFIFKGKGLYDQCSSLFDLTKQRNNLYRNYQNRMEMELEGLPQIMKDIIKRCLDVDDYKRYAAKVIAEKIKWCLQKEGKIASNMISTLDEEDSITADITSQTLNLVRFYKGLQQQEKCELTKNKLFQILSHNSQNVMRLKEIQSLLFVTEQTKSNYSFFVIFYYMSWIEQIEAIIQGRDSTIAENYPQIDPTSLDQNTKMEIYTQLATEKIKFKQCLRTCARLAHSQFRLLDSSVYFPNYFKEIVTAIIQGCQVNYNKLSDNQIRTDMKTFYEQRIRNEYYARQTGEIVDPKLAIMQQISIGFK